MENLNILFTSHSRYSTGGVELWQRRLGKGLVERGHHVIFCVKQHSKFFREIETDGFERHALPMKGELDPLTVIPMVRLIRNEGIDVVLSMRERDFRLAGS